jgi:tRNA(Ile)-lysidine synthetase-like protein
MSELVERVQQAITRHRLIAPGETLLVGVSGGADSLVLLHVLMRLREPLGLRLHAATLDHGMRGAAGAADAEFVRQIAGEWGVPVTVGRADVPALAAQLRMNPEEAARQVRYGFLIRAAGHAHASKIAVAHHRDDQAETVLMHLIRGSGLNGLRGMLPATPLDAYRLPPDIPITFDPPLAGDPHREETRPVLVRPLLDIARAEIDAYAAAHHLQPRHDATNDDLTYFRNRLRHAVIPLLETLNPNIRETLARMADTLRDDAALIRQAGEAALARVTRASPPGSVILDRSAWAALAPGERRYIIRAAVWRLRPALRDVSFVHVENALAVVDTGKVGAQATLPGGLMLRVDYDALVIGPAGPGAPEIAPGPDAPFLDQGSPGITFMPGDRVRHVSGAWVFEAGPLVAGDDLAEIHADPLAAALAVPAQAWLRLRTRQPGDRFRPRGLGGHSQKLSDTLIAMRAPAAWRDRVPLLTVDSEIAWFVVPTPEGVRGRVAEPFAVRTAAPGPDKLLIAVRWRRIR